jgi:predicted nucleotidyltransferase
MNIFGSWATGFILKDSDIDLAISPLILNYFVSYFGTTRDKIASALHYIKSMI